MKSKALKKSSYPVILLRLHTGPPVLYKASTQQVGFMSVASNFKHKVCLWGPKGHTKDTLDGVRTDDDGGMRD